uniref:Uncharacterized protein n=1 Tax=Arion vulgaris TaxID=1028688 RepID=A0A0B6Z0R5_9EUPU
MLSCMSSYLVICMLSLGQPSRSPTGPHKAMVLQEDTNCCQAVSIHEVRNL